MKATFHAIARLAGLVALAPGSFATMPARAAPSSSATLTGTSVVVNDGPGDATDPHVSGDWVSYTDDAWHPARSRSPSGKRSRRQRARYWRSGRSRAAAG
jgi:hypothetical protein